VIEVNRKLVVSVVVPAHNEAENISTVLRAARAAREVDEIIVVDDGSRDDTTVVARREGAVVVRHERNRGKGAAMRTGRDRAKGDVLIFLDGDLRNVTPSKIRRIAAPFRKGCDFVKTRFDRRGGRVTRLTAQPLLGHFFPEIDAGFDQPLSGQIGISKRLVSRLDLENDSGVDIGLLIDACETGAEVKEVYFGRLEHDERELKDLESSARAVSRTILDRAHRYGKVERAMEEIVGEAS
jgi:glycosyltransferase involved in cell wall biosynthesis